MTEFNFKTSAESYVFCHRIREALTKFIGFDDQTAVSKINLYWDDVDSIDDDPLLMSEPAYYYAMCIGHHPMIGDGQKDWEHDERWWPPPPGWER
jgi:hypothetical protein